MSLDGLPNRIREFRTLRGPRQEDLAERVGCSIAQISDLERGDRELSYHWMKAIGRVLRVRPADLFLEKDGATKLSAEERTLVDRFRFGSPDQQSQILAIVEILLKPKKAAKR